MSTQLQLETYLPGMLLEFIDNMATRWADGKKAYKWTYKAVDDAYRPDYEPKHVTTRQRAELQQLESDFIDD